MPWRMERESVVCVYEVWRKEGGREEEKLKPRSFLLVVTWPRIKHRPGHVLGCLYRDMLKGRVYSVLCI